MPFQGQKLKGIADVVFVLDASGSMSSVIEAVRNHIDAFVASINAAQGPRIDMRLGLVVHATSIDSSKSILAYPFTEDVKKFRSWLAEGRSGGDEFTLPAIDRALDFPWRSPCRRFVIAFTDEPVGGGDQSGLQESGVEDLLDKIKALRAHTYLLAPACPVYDYMGRSEPLVMRLTLNSSELATFDFAKFLTALGATVTSTTQSEAPKSYLPNLYNL